MNSTLRATDVSTAAGLIDRVFQQWIQLSPSQAIDWGLDPRDHGLESLTPDFVQDYLHWLERTAADLESVCGCGDNFSRPSIFDLQLLANALRAERLTWAHDPGRYPSFVLRWVGGALLLSLRLNEPPDAECTRALIGRIGATGDALLQARALVAHPSRLAIGTAVIEARELAAFVNQLAADIVRTSSTPSLASDAIAAADSATEGIGAFVDNLVHRVAPGGETAYQDRELWRDRSVLCEGVTASPSEILELGLSETARLQSELSKAPSPTNPEAVPARSGSIADAYGVAVRHARRLGGQMGVLPSNGFVALPHLVAMPGWLATTYRVAVITPRPLRENDECVLLFDGADRGDDGLHQRAQRLLYAAHEVDPGHCLHAVYRRECQSLVRRLLRFRTCTEGWACYVEESVAKAAGCPVAARVAAEAALLRAVRAWWMCPFICAG